MIYFSYSEILNINCKVKKMSKYKEIEIKSFLKTGLQDKEK